MKKLSSTASFTKAFVYICIFLMLSFILLTLSSCDTNGSIKDTDSQPRTLYLNGSNDDFERNIDIVYTKFEEYKNATVYLSGTLIELEGRNGDSYYGVGRFSENGELLAYIEIYSGSTEITFPEYDSDVVCEGRFEIYTEYDDTYPRVVLTSIALAEPS